MSLTHICAGPAPGIPCPTRQLVHAQRGSKTAARCGYCQTIWQYAKDQRRPDRRSYAEQQRRRQAVAEWVAVMGYVCPGVKPLGHAPHAADPDRNPLTAEHIDAFALTHNERGPLTVLCRSINSALGARLVGR